MARKRSTNDMSLSLRFIAQWEERVEKQKKLIAHLRRNRRPTGAAEINLRQQERTVAILRNHSSN
jgi:hypothetical protein